MGNSQPFTLVVEDRSFNLSLIPEAFTPGETPNAGDGWVKVSGPIPWVGEPTEYFPEDIIGLTLKDPEEREYFIAKAEYGLNPCGQRVVNYLWLKPKKNQ